MSINSYLTVCFLLVTSIAAAQPTSAKPDWIKPGKGAREQTWGLHNGIVFSLWPNGVESTDMGTGGPRGLLRIGHEDQGKVYLINFIAIEPVVDGRMEFSEISPSAFDGKWGKLLWTGDSEKADAYDPANYGKGIISRPDPQKPDVEQLTLYLFIEQFLNKANPYFKISIRSDKPDEICFEVFNKPNSAKMDRCALTATMGNYSRLRQLYLNDEVVDSRKLYSGYSGIDFIEKSAFPVSRFLKLKDGSPIVIASTNETLAQLSSWPSGKAYADRIGWKYRAPVKLTQYWRKDATGNDPSLEIRVNGRAKYWAVASRDTSQYVNLPGGPAFENFELREKYYAGQKFYFGITRKTPEELLKQ